MSTPLCNSLRPKLTSEYFPSIVQEEHAEYVRSMATLSAFMAGFVNIAFVQFDFTASYLPYNVLMGFGVSNALTVGPTWSRLSQKPPHF